MVVEFAAANSVAAAAVPSGADNRYPVLVVPSLYKEPEAPVHAHQLAVVLLARVCEVPATFPRTEVVLSSESIVHKVCVPVLVTLDELQAPRVLNGVCAATGTAAVPSAGTITLIIILQQFGKIEDAELCYRKAIELNPNYPQALYNLGIILQELGKLGDAELCYRKAIELNPDYPQALHNLGITLQELGKLEDAELCYRKAIELNPDYYQSRSLLGVLLLELGKHNEGIKEKAKSDGSISFDLKNGLSIC